MRLLYTLLLALATPLILLRLVWRARKQPAYLRNVGERFGFYGQIPTRPLIWLHAVSVGETRAAEPLVKALEATHPEYQILLTHMTPTGRETGEQLFGSRVVRCYVPYDLPGCIGGFLRHFRPRVGILMETELWPNLIHASRSAGIPLYLVNARLSERSAQGYARVASLTRGALGALTAIGAQTEADSQRLQALGAHKVVVTGNLKFDRGPRPQDLQWGAHLRELFRGEPSTVAAEAGAAASAALINHSALAAARPSNFFPPSQAEVAQQAERFGQAPTTPAATRSPDSFPPSEGGVAPQATGWFGQAPTTAAAPRPPDSSPPSEGGVAPQATGWFRQEGRNRPVVLAASTREGEEELVLDAVSALPEPVLIVIVPRHPQRFDVVARLVQARGLKFQRRSEERAVAADTRVVLGDSMGELFAYYAACDLAFIGGSLLPLGGQNLLEACAVGKPVVIGPHTFNFTEATRLAVDAGAAIEVADAHELGIVLATLLGDSTRRQHMGAAGRALMLQHQGATVRTLALLSFPPA